MLNAQSLMLGELLASRIADNIAGNRFWWRHQHPQLGATTAAHCQIERGGGGPTKEGILWSRQVIDLLAHKYSISLK